MVYFFGGNRDFLSNFYPSPFVLDNRKYNCVEQFFMASKAVYFNDTHTESLILATSIPKEQKRLGRSVANFDPEKWDSVKVQIMKIGLLAKFTQNPLLKTLLLETKDQVLAEASPWDQIWGIGYSAQEAMNVPFHKWGCNLLGYSLMEVRDFLRGYWITADFGCSLKGNLLIGALPSEQQIDFLLQRGCNLFVSLIDQPYYFSLLPQEVERKVFPLPLGGVASDSQTLAFLDWLYIAYVSGKVIYLHCKGGIGRTSLIASLFLHRFFSYSRNHALKSVKRCIHSRIMFNRKFMPIPETPAQIEQFLRLSKGEEIDLSQYSTEAVKRWKYRLNQERRNERSLKK